MIDLDGQDTPEVHLFRAVIVQAMSDATMTLPTLPARTTKQDSHRVENQREQRDARAFLTGNSSHFRMICEFAMLDPAAIRDTALKMERAGWPKSMTKEQAMATDYQRAARKRAFRKRAA